MILFWGSKGYQKDLGHTQTAIECGHCNNVDTWEIVETGRKLPSTGFHFFLTVKLTSFLVRFATMVKKLRNLKLKTI